MSDESVTGGLRWVATVTARTLGRDTAAVLARVAEKRHPILVTRGGMPVAVLEPLDGVQFHHFTRETSALTGHDAGTQHQPDLTRLTEHELTEIHCRLLLLVDDRIHYLQADGYIPGDDLHLELTWLEIRGFVSRRMAGYSLTGLGARVVEMLRLSGWTKQGAGTWIPGIAGGPEA